MTVHYSLEYEFVTHIPDTLVEGVVYVSIPSTTVLHLCCCGCGEEVVTPLSPTDWNLTFDDETISLCPSVGNWRFACRSHYWIRRNEVIWDQGLSERKVRRGICGRPKALRCFRTALIRTIEGLLRGWFGR